MDIKEIRAKIDAIDTKMVDLYKQRMEAVNEVSEYKRANKLPVYDSERERNLLNRVGEQAGSEYEGGVRAMFQTVMESSRAYQHHKANTQSTLSQKMDAAVDSTDKLFPPKVMVACQGVEGAYSQIACEKLFRAPSIMYCRNFESVFAAIESGLCRYGVLPLENTVAGSVNSVYDQMIAHNFYIVRSTRIKVDHVLLAKPGVKLEDIKEVYSHEQAINQCSRFLAAHKDIHVNVCSNTAAAAKQVSESDRNDIAAISSANCAALYGLSSLVSGIQNDGNNHTRFICISKKLEIYPGANRTSMMMVLPNKPGSLYHVLGRFYARGIDLAKLESRPIPGHDFEFMFYFDINASIYAPDLKDLIAELDTELDQFKYLGSYLEEM